MTPHDLPLLLTAGDLAELFRTSRAAIYQMRSRGQAPPAVKIGGRLRFDREAVLDYLRRASSSDAA